jgi:rhodanese-related sulfurtransferase
MDKFKYILPAVLTALFFITLNLYAVHEGIYPVKRPHGGMNIKPKDAFEMIQKNPGSFHIVDVRTRYEYQDIGHPEGAFNIPLLFYSTEIGKKGYKKVMNQNFCRDLKARFNSKTDALFFICRSAERSTIAVDEAIKCGFEKDHMYNVLGGFEGDKVHDKESPFYGQRMLGGWRHEGLPWTYKMNPELMYRPDVKK